MTDTELVPRAASHVHLDAKTRSGPGLRAILLRESGRQEDTDTSCVAVIGEVRRSRQQQTRTPQPMPGSQEHIRTNIGTGELGNQPRVLGERYRRRVKPKGRVSCKAVVRRVAAAAIRIYLFEFFVSPSLSPQPTFACRVSQHDCRKVEHSREHSGAT